jgi:hypothetical protein
MTVAQSIPRDGTLRYSSSCRCVIAKLCMFVKHKLCSQVLRTEIHTEEKMFVVYWVVKPRDIGGCKM